MSQDEYDAILDTYAANPRFGQVIVGTGGLRKGRAGKDASGKSGGYPVFSVYLGATVPVFLLWIINKVEDETISAAQRKAFKGLIDDIRKELG